MITFMKSTGRWWVRTRIAGRRVSVGTYATREAAEEVVKNPPRASRIYFVQGRAGGPIKIGRAFDIEARLRQLQTGSPDRLILVGQVRGGAVREYRLHCRFAHLREGGEWFRAAPDLVAYIRGIFSASPVTVAADTLTQVPYKKEQTG